MSSKAAILGFSRTTPAARQAYENTLIALFDAASQNIAETNSTFSADNLLPALEAKVPSLLNLSQLSYNERLAYLQAAEDYIPTVNLGEDAYKITVVHSIVIYSLQASLEEEAKQKVTALMKHCNDYLAYLDAQYPAVIEAHYQASNTNQLSFNTVTPQKVRAKRAAFVELSNTLTKENTSAIKKLAAFENKLTEKTPLLRQHNDGLLTRILRAFYFLLSGNKSAKTSKQKTSTTSAAYHSSFWHAPSKQTANEMRNELASNRLVRAC